MNDIQCTRKITELEIRIEQLELQIAAMKLGGNKPYYSIKEYASIMSVTPQTIYNRIHTGDIPAVKIGNTWRISAANI